MSSPERKVFLWPKAYDCLFWKRVRKGWTNTYLSFTGFLSVADVLESIIEDGHLNHFVFGLKANKS